MAATGTLTCGTGPRAMSYKAFGHTGIQDWPLEVTAALEGHWCQLRLGWVEPSKWELLWRATSTGWDYFGGVPDGVGWELL